MRLGGLLLVSAVVAVFAAPAVSDPALAQNPRRILGPLTAPLGMMMRTLPRPQYRQRSQRKPRAVQRRPARETPAAAQRTRPDQRRQIARGAAPVAGAAVAFWPVAAPDAFEDMLGYALWPREYARQFWSHGPRDIIQAMTAPTAAYASADGSRLPRLGVTSASAGDRAICIARINESAMRPLDRVAEALNLNAEQRQKLDQLRSTVRAAIEAENAACRSDIPETQPQRLRAMIEGLWAMRYAEFRIRPALVDFYNSLSDTQKAQLSDEPQTVGSSREPPDNSPAAVCREAMTAGANPFGRIGRALQPTDEQQKSLQMLYGASMEMAKFLTGTCPKEHPATPIARLDAAGDRIMALLHAAMNIEPILGEFYGKLSDSQRERFNTAIR